MLWAKKVLCLAALVAGFVTFSSAARESSLTDLWSKFETTRQGVRALHQEFEVTRQVNTGHANQLSKHRIMVDISGGEWRQQSIGGGDDLTRIFDGQDLFLLEPDGTEYTRSKHKRDKDAPLPDPYQTKLDWNKAKVLGRMPCGFQGKDHDCVVIEAPIKSWMRPGAPGEIIKMNNGTARVLIDTETGIWLSCHVVEAIDAPWGSYQMDSMYVTKQMSYGSVPDASLYKMPGTAHEVKKLTPWDAARLKKELVGKPAPELQVTDIQGKPVSLSALKGKTILLDFWTTWCPPCRADAPSIEKLNEKYADKGLAVIGVSVDEDRGTVENYLKKHPRDFPVVLSSDNEMPRPYQIHVFPTYLIIAPDGTLKTAEEGDQGFGKLRKELEKAGMSAE